MNKKEKKRLEIILADTGVHAISDVITLPNMAAAVMYMIELVDESIEDLKQQSADYAEKEDAYRIARATIYLESNEQLMEARGVERPTVEDKKMWVDLHTSRERVEAHLAESMMFASKSANESRRAQLSALQSVLSALREEMGMASYR